MWNWHVCTHNGNMISGAYVMYTNPRWYQLIDQPNPSVPTFMVRWYMRNIMMTSSNGNIFHVTGPLWGESTGDRWIPLTTACTAEIRCFLWYVHEQNNRDASDLRCHRAQYDVTVMSTFNNIINDPNIRMVGRGDLNTAWNSFAMD